MGKAREILKSGTLPLFCLWFLTGCSSSILSVNCHYQPVRGSLLIQEVRTDKVRFQFQPYAAPDNELFRKARINTERMTMGFEGNRLIPELHSRYDAIINLRTAGPCAPYITYLGRKL